MEIYYLYNKVIKIKLIKYFSYVQIRVSSEITNAPFILNLDCDMYSNNADIIQEILCFFMDEKKGDEFAFVQCPQHFNNLTKNDIYANRCLATAEVSNKYITGGTRPFVFLIKSG